MRGYLSFVLVFVSVLLLLYVLQLHLTVNDFNLDKAIAVHRTYSVQMNVKEVLLELARQNAEKGFNEYDSSHSVSLCRHCPDHFCIPGSPSNNCDVILCNQCFREKEARESAEKMVISGLTVMNNYSFDPDFTVSIANAETNAFLKADLLSRNGFSLDYIKFRNNIMISLYSEKFEVSAKGKIPQGCVVYHEGSGYC